MYLRVAGPVALIFSARPDEDRSADSCAGQGRRELGATFHKCHGLWCCGRLAPRSKDNRKPGGASPLGPIESTRRGRADEGQVRIGMTIRIALSRDTSESNDRHDVTGGSRNKCGRRSGLSERPPASSAASRRHRVTGLDDLAHQEDDETDCQQRDGNRREAVSSASPRWRGRHRLRLLVHLARALRRAGQHDSRPRPDDVSSSAERVSRSGHDRLGVVLPGLQGGHVVVEVGRERPVGFLARHRRLIEAGEIAAARPLTAGAAILIIAISRRASLLPTVSIR
jgi:hypothetical protein